MKHYLSILLFCVFTGCSKQNEGTSPAMSQSILAFSRKACDGGTVTRYDYDGQQLFLFDDNCNYADGGASVTDGNGNPVCFLGGFSGNLTCLNKRFDTTAKNPLVVYRK